MFPETCFTSHPSQYRFSNDTHASIIQWQRFPGLPHPSGCRDGVQREWGGRGRGGGQGEHLWGDQGEVGGQSAAQQSAERDWLAEVFHLLTRGVNDVEYRDNKVSVSEGSGGRHEKVKSKPWAQQQQQQQKQQQQGTELPLEHKQGPKEKPDRQSENRLGLRPSGYHHPNLKVGCSFPVYILLLPWPD